MKIYVYSVEGDGPFPIIMLTKETAWPQGPYEADQIKLSIEKPKNDGWLIRLESIKKPSESRWEDFECKVRDLGFHVVEGLRDQED